MTVKAIYCTRCDATYLQDIERRCALLCGHGPHQAVYITTETVGGHEFVSLRWRNNYNATFTLRPDGNGGRWVEYRRKLVALDAFLDGLRPELVAAFHRRRDVRREAE